MEARENCPRKILVVDDNADSRELVNKVLRQHGFVLIEAADGEEALNKAFSERPDLILMDMSLPVMDGWAATQAIKADPELSKIPVIALTAHAMAGDREKAMAAGCDDYDTKPIELPRLLEKIGKFLPNV